MSAAPADVDGGLCAVRPGEEVVSLRCVCACVCARGREARKRGGGAHECEHQKTTAPTRSLFATLTDIFIGGISSLAHVADAGITHVVVRVLVLCACVDGGVISGLVFLF